MHLGALSRGRRRGLLRGLWRSVPDGSYWLGRPLASNAVRIDVRGRAKQQDDIYNVRNSDKTQIEVQN